jgi:predicted deacetylase
MKMQLIVEIHDVTPARWPEVDALVHRLGRLGVLQPTLLVVPDYELRGSSTGWDMRQHPHYLRWLRERVSGGAEVVLHGLTHRAPSAPPFGLRSMFMHTLYSRGCAEFAHLDYHAASMRLSRGLEILAECGLEAAGFVAPAWQQSDAAQRAVADAGFAFSAFIDSVRDLRSREREYAPCLTFAAANALIDAGKRLVMRAIERRDASVGLLRVALHPEDMRRAGLIEHIERRIVALLKTRALTDYRRYFDLPKEPSREPESANSSIFAA